MIFGVFQHSTKKYSEKYLERMYHCFSEKVSWLLFTDEHNY